MICLDNQFGHVVPVACFEGISWVGKKFISI